MVRALAGAAVPRTAGTGRLLLCEPGPRERLPETGHLDLPVVLLPDELRWHTQGAAGLDFSGAALRWSGGNIVIHDETPLADEYLAPLAKARQTGRMMIVATSAEHTAGWNDLAVKVRNSCAPCRAAPRPMS